MSMLFREVLVAYDVENNKKRNYLFKKLKELGLRPVQKSVFWGFVTLAEKRAVSRLFKGLDIPGDRAFIINASLKQQIMDNSIGYSKNEFFQPDGYDIL